MSYYHHKSLQESFKRSKFKSSTKHLQKAKRLFLGHGRGWMDQGIGKDFDLDTSLYARLRSQTRNVSVEDKEPWIGSHLEGI